ncbi:Uncharacterized protein Rs2_03425 [Raphanus sativus]|nr:Uncharacterized protein Rs2_03425 [Raphanus sativus]
MRWDAKNITKGGKLINLEMLLIDEQNAGLSAQVDNEIPKFIVDIVGKSYTFQLKLGEFSFTAKHQTFTISRIITECQRRLLPEFVIDVALPPMATQSHGTSLIEGYDAVILLQVDQLWLCNTDGHCSSSSSMTQVWRTLCDLPQCLRHLRSPNRAVSRAYTFQHSISYLTLGYTEDREAITTLTMIYRGQHVFSARVLWE